MLEHTVGGKTSVPNGKLMTIPGHKEKTKKFSKRMQKPSKEVSGTLDKV